MAYVTPPTAAPGATAKASDFNILGADIEYLYGVSQGVTFSAVRVTRSAATGVANATWAIKSFTAETYDYGSWWSSGTNVVVPAGAIPAGYTTIAVQVQARCIFDANATGYRGVRILKNGSAEVTGTQAAFATDSAHVQCLGYIIVAAADILTVEVYQNSGGALDVSSTQFDVARHAPVA